jgi:hypothetical protein
MTQRYIIDELKLSLADENIQDILGQSYANKKRPLCACTSPPVEMYIAKVNNIYLVKRMPGTGSRHDTDCQSFEIPIELSGLGQVMGSAIQESIDDGVASLKLRFSLSKAAPRTAPCR